MKVTEVPEKKEPGTWNAWLGSTGMKAAGKKLK